EDEDHPDILTACETLDMLGRTIRELNLVTELKAEETFYRLRFTEEGQTYTTPEELGSPPLKSAKYPNRMSAAGVSMFYGARDIDTCLVETATGTTAAYTVSKWDTVKQLYMLDMTVFKKNTTFWNYTKGYPSVFDEQNRRLLPALQFLSDF